MSFLMNSILSQLQNDPTVDPAFQQALRNVPPKGLTAEDKVRKLRLALEGLYEVVCSFEDVSLTRDLPEHEALEVYNEAKAYAKHVMQECK